MTTKDTPDSDRTVIRPAPGGRRAAPAAAPMPVSTPVPTPVPMPPAADADRTIIRPSPGGRAASPRPATPPLPTSSSPSPSPLPVQPAPILGDAVEIPSIGDDALATAAAPLLQLLARLRNTATQPDPGDFRARALQEIRHFEQRARDGGVPMDQLRPAHYVLCASLDDVIANTPWGSAGDWASRGLAASFHQETEPGARFFELLSQLRQKPDKYAPVIALMYLCLSLGFMGRFRTVPRGSAEIDRLRQELHDQLAAARPPVEAGLSPQWQGISAPYRPRRARLPLWVVAAGALAGCGLLFVLASTSLNAASDSLFERVLSVPPSAMPAITRAALVVPPPPPPPPPEPTALDRLQTDLQPIIAQGQVSVQGTPGTPVLRVPNRLLFGSASATLLPTAPALLEKLGAALAKDGWTAQVVGFTDNQPIRTVAFPSNFHLSTARALAARAPLAKGIGDAKRVTSEGRGEADPVGPNATPEGREQNRRIDIVLHRQD